MEDNAGLHLRPDPSRMISKKEDVEESEEESEVYKPSKLNPQVMEDAERAIEKRKQKEERIKQRLHQSSLLNGIVLIFYSYVKIESIQFN